MNSTTTKVHAYRLMLSFLDTIYDRYFPTFDNDFPVMLGSMQLLSDGISKDPAYVNNWKAYFDHERLSAEEIYQGMIRLLDEYIARGDSGEITAVKTFLENDPRASRDWQEMVAGTLC